MISVLRPVPMHLSILLLPAPLVAGCVATPPIVASQSACSSLIPDSWREGVEGASLPRADTVGEWMVYGDAQTGQLDKANSRTVDAIGVIERCEARDRDAVNRSRRRWWQIF
jgi:hypothetical protein